MMSINVVNCRKYTFPACHHIIDKLKSVNASDCNVVFVQIVKKFCNFEKTFFVKRLFKSGNAFSHDILIFVSPFYTLQCVEINEQLLRYKVFHFHISENDLYKNVAITEFLLHYIFINTLLKNLWYDTCIHHSLNCSVMSKT